METKLRAVLALLASTLVVGGVANGCSSQSDSEDASVGCGITGGFTGCAALGCSGGSESCGASGDDSASCGAADSGCSGSGCVGSNCFSGCASCGNCSVITGACATNCGVGGGDGNSGAGGGAASLIAGDWDDNRNFDYFQDYRASFEATYPVADFESESRVVVQVVDAHGAPVAGAHVTVTPSGNGMPVLDTSAGSNGQVLFFPERDAGPNASSFSVSASGPAGEGLVTVNAPMGSSWQLVIGAEAPGAPASLDVAFVIDTTSSMVGPLEYLQSAMPGIVASLASSYPNVSARFGLVVYRDTTDAYTVQSSELTADPNAFVMSLTQQMAAGGGDTPEAVEQGLHAMNQLGWRGGNVARIAFLVGDAPPHPSQGDAFFDEVDAARRTGVHIYPIAGSSLDEYAEYFFRAAAEATAGRFLFVTSTGGDPKLELPCYQTERLDSLIERVVSAELQGAAVPAASTDVTNAIGDPHNGICTLTNGSTVSF